MLRWDSGGEFKALGPPGRSRGRREHQPVCADGSWEQPAVLCAAAWGVRPQRPALQCCSAACAGAAGPGQVPGQVKGSLAACSPALCQVAPDQR